MAFESSIVVPGGGSIVSEGEEEREIVKRLEDVRKSRHELFSPVPVRPLVHAVVSRVPQAFKDFNGYCKPVANFLKNKVVAEAQVEEE